ncbi:MAG: DUF4369 domain-containing protein, partial [Bacteroidetes bacterium]|nr:DUF4369 domain-containing protein [Bacteroidota bacterium]
MKKFFLPLAGLMLAFAGASAQTTGFTLNGDVSKLSQPIEWIYLGYMSNGQRINDSVKVVQGKYSFTGNLSEPLQAGLRVKYHEAPGTQGMFNRKRDYALLFLQPGTIGVISTDSFSNITVTGSKADADYRKLELAKKPYDEKLDKLYAQYTEARGKKDEAAMKSLEKVIDSLDEAANEHVYGSYVKQNPNRPIALYALQNWAGYSIDPNTVEPVFSK